MKLWRGVLGERQGSGGCVVLRREGLAGVVEAKGLKEEFCWMGQGTPGIEGGRSLILLSSLPLSSMWWVTWPSLCSSDAPISILKMETF